MHSYDEFQFVKNFNGLRSILEDIYKESSINIKNLKPFNKFLTLLFHNITGYVELDIEKYPKNIKEPLKETLRVLDNFSYDKNKTIDGEMHETYMIGCNHCFSLYDSDFVLIEVDMRQYIGYTIRHIA